VLAKNIGLPVQRNPSADLRPNDIYYYHIIYYHGVSIRGSERYDYNSKNN
jgi:hypothetical protein